MNICMPWFKNYLGVCYGRDEGEIKSERLKGKSKQ